VTAKLLVTDRPQLMPRNVFFVDYRRTMHWKAGIQK